MPASVNKPFGETEIKLRHKRERRELKAALPDMAPDTRYGAVMEQARRHADEMLQHAVDTASTPKARLEAEQRQQRASQARVHADNRLAAVKEHGRVPLHTERERVTEQLRLDQQQQLRRAQFAAGEERYRRALRVDCPWNGCRAPAGAPCRNTPVGNPAAHPSRYAAAGIT